jgi:transposase-like protein
MDSLERSIQMSTSLGTGLSKRYSQAFKQQVVSEIESGIYTISQAQQLYRIGSNSTIRNWLRQFGKNHLLSQRVHIQTTEEVNQLKQLASDKQRLESALADAHLKIARLESQLCQAETQFGIDMKKK